MLDVFEYPCCVDAVYFIDEDVGEMKYCPTCGRYLGCGSSDRHGSPKFAWGIRRSLSEGSTRHGAIADDPFDV